MSNLQESTSKEPEKGSEVNERKEIFYLLSQLKESVNHYLGGENISDLDAPFESPIQPDERDQLCRMIARVNAQLQSIRLINLYDDEATSEDSRPKRDNQELYTERLEKLNQIEQILLKNEDFIAKFHLYVLTIHQQKGTEEKFSHQIKNIIRGQLESDNTNKISIHLSNVDYAILASRIWQKIINDLYICDANSTSPEMVRRYLGITKISENTKDFVLNEIIKLRNLLYFFDIVTNSQDETYDPDQTEDGEAAIEYYLPVIVYTLIEATQRLLNLLYNY